MFSSFQHGFQVGFQVIYGAGEPIPAPNGNSTDREAYVPRYYELQAEERRNRKLTIATRKTFAKKELDENERRIEELELKRLRSDLADKNQQAELLQLILASEALNAEIIRLEALMAFMIQADEDILILMMSLPFS